MGGGITVIIVGFLFGVIFTVVFARLRDRLPATTDLGRSLLLAAIGFVVFSLLPAIRIPSNPPAVGDPSTVERADPDLLADHPGRDPRHRRRARCRRLAAPSA